MAVDLAPTPTSGLTVQACGDAHLSNFGLFASPERDAACSTSTTSTRRCPGPGSGTSSGSSRASSWPAGSAGFAAHDNRHAVHACVRAYRERMAEYAAMRAFDVFYARVDAAEITTYVDKRARPFLASTAGADDEARQPPRAAQADRARRGRRPPDRRPSAGRHPPPELTVPTEVVDAGRLPRHAPGGPARAPRPLPTRGRRAQGRRCR